MFTLSISTYSQNWRLISCYWTALNKIYAVTFKTPSFSRAIPLCVVVFLECFIQGLHCGIRSEVFWCGSILIVMIKVDSMLWTCSAFSLGSNMTVNRLLQPLSYLSLDYFRCLLSFLFCSISLYMSFTSCIKASDHNLNWPLALSSYV